MKIRRAVKFIQGLCSLLLISAGAQAREITLQTTAVTPQIEFGIRQLDAAVLRRVAAPAKERPVSQTASSTFKKQRRVIMDK